jgi:pimeloyl-ACP methyl ester carboxylesterase
MRRKRFLNLGPHGFHHVAYTEWGDAGNPRVLLCVHGLTRCGGDFDLLAQALADGWRVVCPDMPGRGASDWLAIKADYAIPVYIGICATLIARLEVERVDWLGTSMGGIIGMTMAAFEDAPIGRLIVNDVGPHIPAEAIGRIAAYVGQTPYFATPAEAEAFLRNRMAPFGISRQEHWDHIVAISTRPAEGGGLTLHYDPAIAQAFVGEKVTESNFWPVWDAIRCPVLILRGEHSDLLIRETAQMMTARGPRATLVEFPGCGHAPALMEPEQIRVIKEWLEQ